MIARCYIRVSTARQERGVSLDTQRDMIATYATGRDIPVVWYQDVLSGTRDDRPAYAQLVKDLQPGDMVIVWRLDRIGRRKSELFRFFEQCKQLRVSLISVTQPDLSNELVRDIMSVIAAFESQQLAERVLPNQLARVQDGRYVSRPPRWYAIGADGHLTPAEDAEDAQRAFEMFVATRNLEATATAFDTRTRTLMRHIRNRVYLGEIQWAGVTVRGAHPAVVTAPVWEAANAIIDGRVRGKRRARADTALLTGYLFVGGTGRRLYRQPDVRRGNHRYSTREDGLPLSRYSVRCDVADAYAVEQLASLELTRGERVELVRAVRERAKDDPHRRARAKLAKQRESLELERDGTAAMLARGQIDRERWERMDARQARELAAIAAQIAALPSLPDPAAVATIADLRIGLAERVYAAWEARNVALLRVLLDAFVARIELWSEPTEGLQGKARGYWKENPPRLTTTWTDAVIQRQ